MKKLLTLILLFTITFYSIPSEAYTLDGNDIPLVQTKNLFDKDTMLLNIGLTPANGFTGSSSLRHTSDFIDILPNIEFIGSGTYTQVALVFFDINKNYISGLATSNKLFTTPSNAFFVRFSINITLTFDLETIQVEQGATATFFAPYGFLTLNELFDDGNVVEPNFTNFTIGSPGAVYTFNGLDMNVVYTTNSSFIDSPAFTIGHNVYVNFDAKINSITTNNPRILFDNVEIYNETSVSNTFDNYSSIQPMISGARYLRISRSASGATFDVSYRDIKLINLTTLGIDHLSKRTIDSLLNEYKQTNAFIEGYNEGFDDGFAEGFDDGFAEGFDDRVASDTSYAVGYALGLSEGQDMETGSSLLILVVAAIGFIMMIFGFTTKRGIFNLLSVGAFVVLGTLLAQFVGFIIITAGLVIINVYYAFFGNS